MSTPDQAQAAPDARRKRPAWVTSDYGTSYEEIVASWGHEVLHTDIHGSYQGDYTTLLRDGDRFGFSLFGYGSCSGCDALEAIVPWADREDDDWTAVADLADEMKRDVKWFDSALALADWLDEQVRTEGKGSDWYWYDREVKAAATRYAEELRNIEHLSSPDRR